MGINTNDAKSFEEMASEQEAQETAAESTEPCTCKDDEPCEDKDCPCTETPKTE